MAGGDALQLDLITHVDLRVVLGFGGHCGIAGEVRFAHEHGDFGGVFGQEHGFLGCGAVAGGAVGHAAAGVLGLALEAQLARAGAGGDEDAEGLEVAA